MNTETYLKDLDTPRIVLDLDRLEQNLKRLQDICTQHGVELWPHIKTHKMVEVAKRQIALGATGLTCAKIGEAEALLPSGVRRVFIAHSIVDPKAGPRLVALSRQLDELIVAVTSARQAEALNAVLAAVDLTLPVMQAVDTGLGREGSRSLEEAKATAEFICKASHLKLRGFYSHEGQSYGRKLDEVPAAAEGVRKQLDDVRQAIDPALPIWPGCSVTGFTMATLPNVQAIRPGAYVFGDLSLCQRTQVMPWESAAVTVLTTVVDHPQPGLALIDAGSKTFSGDKSPDGGLSGIEATTRKLEVFRVNEEHGYVRGEDVDELALGQQLRVIPSHICPVLNLTDEVIVVRGDKIVDRWTVEARGKVR